MSPADADPRASEIARTAFTVTTVTTFLASLGYAALVALGRASIRAIVVSLLIRSARLPRARKRGSSCGRTHQSVTAFGVLLASAVRHHGGIGALSLWVLLLSP